MNRDKMKQFVKTVQQELEERGIGKREFAQMVGVSRMTVYRWFNGKPYMSLENYYKILKALGWENKAL